MQPLSFAKYHGLGNDFIVVLDHNVTSEFARVLCDRHRGIGADGVLMTGLHKGRPYMRVLNADGSTAEMCGNGIRCVARFLAGADLVPNDKFEIDTDGGPHWVSLRGEQVEVAMAIPSLEPSAIPMRASNPVVDEPMAFEGRELRLTAVSMGNPHVVTFDPVGEARHALGPKIERDARFPNRTNVGFAVMDRDRMDLAVWERGVGFTQACGTGACAAVVAAVETGRWARGTSLSVRLPGGTLDVVVNQPGEPVIMIGPAVHVFDGLWTGPGTRA